MQKVSLKAEKRTETGKGGSRALRRSHILPAVLYGKGSSIPIKIQKKELIKFMMTGGRDHALVNIEIMGGKGKKSDHWAVVKEYQLDPVRSELLHVDFVEISLKEKMKTTTAIVITKNPVGVKNGGILQQQLREVEIECLPTHIPAGLEVDASPVDIGQSLHVSDLIPVEGVKVLNDPNEVILTVSAPVMEEAAAEAPAVVEGEEPELVKKSKGKEGEEEASAEAPKKEKEEKKEK